MSIHSVVRGPPTPYPSNFALVIQALRPSIPNVPGEHASRHLVFRQKYLLVTQLNQTKSSKRAVRRAHNPRIQKTSVGVRYGLMGKRQTTERVFGLCAILHAIALVNS